MLKVRRKGSIFSAKSGKEKDNAVGATYVAVAIRNPAEPERVWEGEFLIDTGATDSLVPRQHLESIGLVPEGQRTYGMTDGNGIPLDITVAQLEFMGEIVGGTVAFGAENSEPLLGVTALESAGIEVDPHNETLNKLPAARMRGFRPRL